MQSVLSVSAHPDDASIFWGGTLLRLVDEGWAATQVTVDDGRGAPHSFEMDTEALMATRAQELIWESMRLGVSLEHLSLPGVKTTANRDLAHAELTRIITEVRPARVITHSLNDSHGTHVLVCRLTLRALVAVHEADPSFALPEVWQADGWEPVHYPDVRVDITPYMNNKMAAISQHSSQTFDTPYMMGAWGLCLYRAGMAASHDVTDPRTVFAEVFRRIAPEILVATAAAHDPEA